MKITMITEERMNARQKELFLLAMVFELSIRHALLRGRAEAPSPVRSVWDLPIARVCFEADQGAAK